jgi:putative membrane protein
MVKGIFRAPEPASLLGFILLLSALLGVIAWGTTQGLVWGSALGLGVFGLPVLGTALVTKPLAEVLGGKMYLRRSTLLALFGEVMVLPWLLAYEVLRWGTLERFLLVGLASTLWLRQVILLATSHSNPFRSLPAAMVQPLLGFAILLPLVSGGYLQFNPYDALVGAMALGSFGLMGFAFTAVAIRPLSRGFGVDGLAMLRYSLDHWTEHGEEGKEEMEAFFDAWGTDARTRLGVLLFREGLAARVMVVVPTVHPGPFGNLGGSNLPEKLGRSLGDLCPSVLVPHGPSTHDENMATSAQVEKLAQEVRRLVSNLTPVPVASPMVRVGRGAANVTAQAFGDGVVVLASQAPRPTDDLDAATGHAIASSVRGAGAAEAIVVDAHNCLEVGSGMVNFGSQESLDLVEAAAEAARQALKGRTTGLRVGYAIRSELANPVCGLGPQGVQVLVVAAGDQKAAYLLYDGNNMVPGLREKILQGIKDLVEEAEVLTTDNHVVNAWIPGFNPVGLRWDHDELVRVSRELVVRALGDLQEVEVGVGSGVVDGVRVWGHQSAVRLTSTIQSIMTTLRLNAVLTLGFAITLSAFTMAVVPLGP